MESSCQIRFQMRKGARKEACLELANIGLTVATGWLVGYHARLIVCSRPDQRLEQYLRKEEKRCNNDMCSDYKDLSCWFLLFLSLFLCCLRPPCVLPASFLPSFPPSFPPSLPPSLLPSLPPSLPSPPRLLKLFVFVHVHLTCLPVSQHTVHWCALQR